MTAEYYSASTANAEESAGLLSKLFFAYVQPILSRGWREPLTTDAVYEVASRDEASKVSQRFQTIWSNEAGQKKPSLRSALMSFLGSYFLLAGLWKFVWDCLRFVSPLMINQILKFLSKQDEPWYNGLVFVVVLICNEIVQTVCLHRYFHKGVRSAMHCRTALVTAVYRKSLRLSSASRQQFTSGEIVNLMSVDAGRFTTIIPYLHTLWSSPLQFIFAMTALYWLLGWPIFAGVSATIIFIPLNLIFVRKTEKWTEELMKTKDERVRLLSENLQAMKTVKFFAWEKSVEEKVTEIRDKEVQQLRKVRLLESVTDFFWYGTPVIITVITFAVYASAGKPLDVSLIFTALVLFNILKSPLYMLPWVIGTVVSTKVSLNRIEKFLLSEEVSIEGVERDWEEAIENIYYFNDDMLTTEDDDALSDANSPAPDADRPRRDSFRRAASELGLAGLAPDRSQHLTPIPPARKSKALSDEIALNIGHASFTWDNDSSDVLKNINLEVPKGSLVIVIGQVGSGKSSLMLASLGEMHRTRGSTDLQGTVAYSAQNPWVINATVKDNILMGKPYEAKKFKAIVDACGLGPDLKILPGGKNCEIGEKGVSLSGGQKARISLARCLYSGADNYFLDDPLSALDVHVGRHVFKHAVVKYLKSSTRVLVTHHYYTLPAADLVVIMKDGEIAQKGTYRELVAAGVNLNAYLEEEEQHKEEQAAQASAKDSKAQPIENEEEEEDEEEHRFMTEEERNVGMIKFGVYKSYFNLMGRVKFIAVFLCVLLVQTSYIVKDWWLGIWSQKEIDPDVTNTSLRTFLLSYSGIAFTGAMFLLIEEITFALGSVKAAGRIHREMLHSILRTPLSFFDTTPVGRILNRFSKDQETIDSQLPASIMDFLMSGVTVISVVILLCVAAPMFTVFVIPIAILYTYIQRYYIKTSRELQRLDAITTSPIYAHFSTTLTGVQTIRAFGFQKQFIRENERRMNANNKVYFPQMEVNRWLAQRLEMCGTMILSLTALFGVLTRSWADPTLIGLALSYASSITDSLTWLVRYMTALENNMNSVERVRHYTTNLKHEAPMRIPEQDPIDNWPKEGKIDFRELILHYRPELPPALNGLSCEIKGGEHVGIVGRTGAGKSSIMYSLFRLQEPSGGYIMIDGVDISKIGLEVLRSNLSIIPQDPTIFSGTIRSNLDPFAQYDDEELWRVLERVHIKQKIQSLPDLLYTRVTENGENFSLGERQLLCLARALCRRNKIILMDEATAQIDTETDRLIQQTITEEFKLCTVITIAHRLETIVEYDKIIVMESGKIIEVGSPKELAANPASVFANMLTRASSDKLTNSNETNSTISNNSSGSNNNNMNTKPVRPKPKFKIFTAPSKHEKSEAEADLDNINTNDNYNMA